MQQTTPDLFAVDVREDLQDGLHTSMDLEHDARSYVKHPFTFLYFESERPSIAGKQPLQSWDNSAPPRIWGRGRPPGA